MTDTNEKTGNKRKLIHDCLLVESDVRRSERLKEKKKGYKSSQCKSKGWLACEVNPPILDESITRNLGHGFCQLSSDNLSDQKLNAKKKATPVGRKVDRSRKPSSNDNEEKNKQKNSKK
ncbi:hypothetical protein BS78_07G101500 [Paspalum vaginatum]|nr:hypothetical protein BS78_07G101500 [Paspalum vaginatum]